MLDQDLKDRLDKIKQEFYRHYKPIRQPIIFDSVGEQLDRLLARSSRRHVRPADLKKHLNINQAHINLFRRIRKLTNVPYRPRL